MSSHEGRIDYVKLLYTTTPEFFQDHIAPRYEALLHKVREAGIHGKTSKLSALGQERRSSDHRYVVEFWGASADVVARALRVDELQYLRRVDYKEAVHGLSDGEWENAMSALYFRPCKLNTSTIKTKPREKMGEQRDVGGIGMLYGSRKSDEHGVLISRGKNDKYREYRVANKGAVKLRNLVMATVENSDDSNVYRHLLSQLRLQSQFWWGKTLGGSFRDIIEHAAHKGADITAAVAQSSFFDETEQERAWWDSLSPEEQEAEQRGTFEATPKGHWVDDPSDPGDVMWVPDTHDEDDLPF